MLDIPILPHLFKHMRSHNSPCTTQVFMHQQELLSRCMGELCGQVASGCLDRGFFMQQLWDTLVSMLCAALDDRDKSWQIALDARVQV